ncbi:MAG: adenosine kinase [Bacteroidetes bacterium]|nr:adenosine kinase [Bacteroidota bacterium]
MKKVLGMGNALVDILIQIDNDKILENLELPRGSMQLVDVERARRVQEATKEYKRELLSGGSAANTIAGIAKMDIPTAFIGTISKDEMGDVFENELKAIGTKPLLAYSDTQTGTATTLISADSERTFATHLGAAIELSPEQLKKELFQGYDFFYIEGYLVQNHDLIRTAVKVAKEEGLKVCLDLASYNVVDENVDFLHQIIEDYVDVVFANEEEAKSFTGLEPEEALHYIADMCEIAVVKVGKKGSLIKKGDEVFEAGIIKAESIDTTGAGDQYAAGFIYGMAMEKDLAECGRLGSILAGYVIQQYGARILEEKWSEINAMIG